MLTALIIGSLATWRLSYMLQNEVGPFRVLESLRASIDRLDWSSSLREGFYCLGCLSVWVGLLFAAMFYIASTAFYVIGLALAMSTVAILITNIRDKHGF